MSAAVVIQELQALGMPLQQSTGMSAGGMAEDGRSQDRYGPQADGDYMQFYRMYTERLLKRYMRTSMQMGRSGSVLGNLVVRGKASYTGERSFEDAIIFVHDMDTCLKKMDDAGRELVSRIALQEFTQQEVGDMLGMSARSVVRRYVEALDRLTEILLERQVLNELF